MSNEAFDHLAPADPENEEDDQGVTIAFNALKLSNPPVLGPALPCISPPQKPVESVEHARDSGYGSLNTTPDHKDATIPSRKPGQDSFIRQTGLCISNRAMEAGTKKRFLEAQLQIEKMLLEFIRKSKSGSGRYKPIAIRPMMLGKTEADADAKPYMVVICSEKIKRKVQGFFDDPLVKTLYDPGDDNIPPFKALVIGHALRLRALTSDIKVQCDVVNCVHDGRKTFCGMPIRLCDEFGHSRNATFGGIIKVTSAGGEYQLYGLTAGHMIINHRIVTDEDDTSLADSNLSDFIDLNLSAEVLNAPEYQTKATSPTMSNSIDQDDLDNWYFSDKHNLGKVLNADKDMVDEDARQMKPSLDWALFELNAHKPNRIAFHNQENSRGDLELPSPTTDPSKDEIYVSMLCASQGAKHGVLSTTRARVLLDGGDSFTDAYTLSLEGSEASDGDSGSWVVDELRLEVYGHVVADDFFGDVYVTPMSDILSDIQRCLGAKSVDLPSSVDIISTASLHQSELLARPRPWDRSPSHFVSERSEDMSHLSGTGEGLLMLPEEEHATGGMTSAGSAHRTLSTLSTSSSVDFLHRAVSIPPTDIVILYPEHMRRPQPTDSVIPDTLINVAWPKVTRDSGYSSPKTTPNTPSPPQTSLSSPEDKDACKDFDMRLLVALEADDRRAWEHPTEDELVEAFWSLSGQLSNLSNKKLLDHISAIDKDRWIPSEEFPYLPGFHESWPILSSKFNTKDPSAAAVGGRSNRTDVEEFNAALSDLKHRPGSGSLRYYLNQA